MVSLLDIRTLIRVEKNWLMTNKVSTKEKFLFLLKQVRSIILNKRKIEYLGRQFYYDNRTEPFLIAEYPSEIEKIINLIKKKKIVEVLDIGANIGQWGLTMSKLNPETKVYSFEPNPEVYKILTKNNEKIKNWRIYNYAIGIKEEMKNLHYSPQATAEGSFIKENLKQNTKRANEKKVLVKIIPLNKKTIRNLKIPRRFDIVKIDVEGSEMECLKGIKSLDFQYLYIEASIKRNGTKIEEIIKFLENSCKKKTKILYRDLPDKESKSENVLIELS